MTNMAPTESFPILLVEDDSEDVMITRRAFTKAQIKNPLYVVRDGEDALEFLHHRGDYAPPDAPPRPGLILLDLNLPRVDGREVLDHIKHDECLHDIPVVVLTTSNEEADVRGCYEKGANTYIVKPVDYTNFLEAVVTIGEYWLTVAHAPVAAEKCG